MFRYLWLVPKEATVHPEYELDSTRGYKVWWRQNRISPAPGGETGIIPGPSTTGIIPGPSTTGITPGPSTTGIIPGPSTTGIIPGHSTTGITPGPSTTGIIPGPSTVSTNKSAASLKSENGTNPSSDIGSDSSHNSRNSGPSNHENYQPDVNCEHIKIDVRSPGVVADSNESRVVDQKYVSVNRINPVVTEASSRLVTNSKKVSTPILKKSDNLFMKSPSDPGAQTSNIGTRDAMKGILLEEELKSPPIPSTGSECASTAEGATRFIVLAVSPG